MALDLKARRERERRAIVEEKRLQQYRYDSPSCLPCSLEVFGMQLMLCKLCALFVCSCSESCDDCRVEDSRKVQTFVLQDRDKQLDERKRLEEEEVCV